MAGKAVVSNFLTSNIVNGLLITVAVLALAGCAETRSGPKAAVQGQASSSGGYKIGES
jgi:rare lipoprotein A